MNDSNDVPNPQHRIFDYSRGVDATCMALVFVPFTIFWGAKFYPFQKLIYLLKIAKTIPGWNRSFEPTKAFDEDLGSYWECLSGLD